MNLIKNLTIRAKLYLLIGALIGGLVLYGVMTYYTLISLRVKGPYYDQIIVGKDVIADILPPPEYIIESYLLAFQELSETNPNELEQLIQRSRALKEAYYIRHEYWSKNIPEGIMKNVFVNQSYVPASEFFNIMEKKFIPAILEGKIEEARAILDGPMKEKYQLHRKYIDEVVKLTNQENIEIEKRVDHLYEISLWIAVITWLLTIFLGIGFAMIIGKSITGQLKSVLGEISVVSGAIGNKMDQQAQNIVQQSTSVHETTTTMDELNTSFQHTEELALESSKRANHALELSENGNNILNQMLERLMNHKDKVNAIVDKISKLSDLIHQIHNIAAVTGNLSNQTNILALNAAIQAAHVKQHSEGFSVIASEIRKLADDSKKFMKDIYDLSGSIQETSNSMVMMAEEGNKTLQESISLAQTTINAFLEVIKIITSSFEGAEQVSLNVKQQAQAVGQVLEAMEMLNQVSQQSITTTEQVRYELQRLNNVTIEIKKTI
jgi:methyl-accepting chemotaxis protein